LQPISLNSKRFFSGQGKSEADDMLSLCLIFLPKIKLVMLNKRNAYKK